MAKNRYSGDLGVVPLEFDKDALSYQPKKKKSKDEPEKALNQSLEEFSLEERDYVTHFDEPLSKKESKSFKRQSKKTNDDASSYLSDILNLNRTR